MAGKRSDNNAVERISAEGGGTIDVEFDGTKGYVGMFEETGKPYVRVMVGGAPWIKDLIGALQRLHKKVAKAEE
jgi:hypothetical protein